MYIFLKIGTYDNMRGKLLRFNALMDLFNISKLKTEYIQE